MEQRLLCNGAIRRCTTCPSYSNSSQLSIPAEHLKHTAQLTVFNTHVPSIRPGVKACQTCMTHLCTKHSKDWCHTTGSIRSSRWNCVKWSTRPSICKHHMQTFGRLASLCSNMRYQTGHSVCSAATCHRVSRYQAPGLRCQTTDLMIMLQDE